MRHDVVVVGGGAARLSAGMMLAEDHVSNSNAGQSGNRGRGPERVVLISAAGAGSKAAITLNHHLLETDIQEAVAGVQ